MIDVVAVFFLRDVWQTKYNAFIVTMMLKSEDGVMKHRGTIRLETERLVLRRHTLDDAGAVFSNWASDPEVTRYLKWSLHESLNVSREWCMLRVASHANDDDYNWLIVLKSSGEPIGSIGVVNLDEKIESATVGYCIGKAWWSQGYASEALTSVVKFLFEEVGLNRVEARYDPRNVNSGKVMAKAGLAYEGTHRQADWNNQGVCDCVVHALTAEDYKLLS